MKLLYLIDRECRKEYSRGCTGVTWKLWWHGPFSRKVLDTLDDLEFRGIIESDIRDYNDYVVIEYWLSNPDYRVRVDEGVREVIKRIVSRWGHRRLEEILDYVYSLDEVEKASLGDKL